MIQLSTRSTLHISNSTILSTYDGNTPITSTFLEWDLNQLHTIVTVDSLEDDEARKRAAHASERNRNMLGGAVIGGFLDAGSGDDSIVDGVLLGAAFGGLCTLSKESPRAHVGLLFKDGEHLAVEVDKDEYTRLQTIAASNQEKEIGVKPSFAKRALTDNQIKGILECRSSSALSKHVLIAIASVISIGLFPEMLGLIAPEISIPDVVESSLFVVGPVFFVITLFFGYQSSQDLERFLLDDGERERYRRMISPHQEKVSSGV